MVRDRFQWTTMILWTRDYASLYRVFLCAIAIILCTTHEVLGEYDSYCGSREKRLDGVTY